MKGDQAEDTTAQPGGGTPGHRVRSDSKRNLQGDFIETGDDFIDSKQLRVYFPRPDVAEHQYIYSNVSAGIRRQRRSEIWRRQRELGRGGFGTVQLEMEKSGRLRAVKLIPKTIIQTVDYLREILAMAKMSEDSTYFISLLGWFTSTEYIHIAMEYAPCGDLASCVSAPVPQADAQSISAQVVSALAIMHSKHFSHRDLSPANVFVIQRGPSWWVKLGDFGMSKRVHNEQTAFHTSINAVYSAPEMLGLVSEDEEGTYTNAVDMWALGCLMHWLLTYRGPFGATSRSSQRHLYAYALGKETLSVDAMNAEKVPDEVQSLIQQLLAPNPKDRITSTEAVGHRYFWDESYHQGAEAAGWASDTSSIRSIGRINPASSTLVKEKNPTSHLGDPPSSRETEIQTHPQYDQNVQPTTTGDQQDPGTRRHTVWRDFASINTTPLTSAESLVSGPALPRPAEAQHESSRQSESPETHPQRPTRIQAVPTTVVTPPVSTNLQQAASSGYKPPPAPLANDSDSDSSFRRARRLRKPADGSYSMRRSIRSTEVTPPQSVSQKQPELSKRGVSPSNGTPLQLVRSQEEARTKKGGIKSMPQVDVLAPSKTTRQRQNAQDPQPVWANIMAEQPPQLQQSAHLSEKQRKHLKIQEEIGLATESSERDAQSRPYNPVTARRKAPASDLASRIASLQANPQANQRDTALSKTQQERQIDQEAMRHANDAKKREARARKRGSLEAQGSAQVETLPQVDAYQEELDTSQVDPTPLIIGSASPMYDAYQPVTGPLRSSARPDKELQVDPSPLILGSASPSAQLEAWRPVKGSLSSSVKPETPQKVGLANYYQPGLGPEAPAKGSLRSKLQFWKRSS